MCAATMCAATAFAAAGRITKRAMTGFGSKHFENAPDWAMLSVDDKNDETRRLVLVTKTVNPNFDVEFIACLAELAATLAKICTNRVFVHFPTRGWDNLFNEEVRLQHEDYEFAIKHLAHLKCVEYSPKLEAHWTTVFNTKCAEKVAERAAIFAAEAAKRAILAAEAAKRAEKVAERAAILAAEAAERAILTAEAAKRAAQHSNGAAE